MPLPPKPYNIEPKSWAQLQSGLGPCVGFASHSLEALEFDPVGLRFDLSLSLGEPLK